VPQFWFLWSHTGKTTGWKLDHLKFRIHLVESLLLNYSFQHTTSGQHGSDTTTRRLRECHFPRGIPPTQKMSKTRWKSEVSSRHDKRREWILLIGLWCCCVRPCVCVFQGLPWKHYWGNVTRIFTTYGLQEISVPSFILIRQKIWKLFQIKMQFAMYFKALEYCSHTVPWTGV
jgi:hypothetical protein